MTKTLFTNARLIDPVGLTDGIGAVLIDGGQIAEVFETGTPASVAAMTRSAMSVSSA